MSVAALHLSTGVFYAITGLVAMRVLFGRVAAAGAVTQARLRWLGWVVLVGLILHAVALYAATFAPAHLNLSFGNAASLIAWLTLVIYWLATCFDPRLAPLQFLMMPVCALAALLPLAAPAANTLAYSNEPLFIAHFASSMLGYSLAVVALIHSCLMLAVARRLHRADVPKWVDWVPPLLQMERVLFRVLLAAFLLLTVVVVTGVFFSETMFGKPFRITHKTVFGILSWLIFGGLLLTHHLSGLRGRIAARWTIAGFMFLMLGYFGSKFVLEVILQRAASS